MADSTRPCVTWLPSHLWASLLTAHVLFASLLFLTRIKPCTPITASQGLPLLIIQVSGQTSPLQGFLCPKKTTHTPTASCPKPAGIWWRRRPAYLVGPSWKMSFHSLRGRLLEGHWNEISSKLGKKEPKKRKNKRKYKLDLMNINM